MRAPSAHQTHMNHKNERSRHIGSAPAAPKPPAEASQPDAAREPGRETCRGVYHISIVAELVETHPQTLRMYERMGLVSPQRTRNNIRLYSEADVERVRRIQHLTQDLGVNLAGVEVVFKLLQQMERMHEELQTLREQSRFGEAMPPLDRNGRA